MTAFKNADILIKYGECDVSTGDNHKFTLIYDKLVNNEEYSICLDCAKNVLFKKVPESREGMISYESFADGVKKKINILELDKYIKYFCCNPAMNKVKSVNVYKRNKHSIAFEIIEWDEYKEQVMNNEILNIDYIAKTRVDNFKKKK